MLYNKIILNVYPQNIIFPDMKNVFREIYKIQKQIDHNAEIIQSSNDGKKIQTARDKNLKLSDQLVALKIIADKLLEGNKQ